MSTRIGVSVTVVFALLLGAAAVFSVASASADGRGGKMFPNVELITQDGKKVHFYDGLIKGKKVAIDLICTTCQYARPLETARLAQAQEILRDRVGKDIFFYSISVDPEHDTPEVLKAYMERFHVGPGWTFLTGKQKDITFLNKGIGLYAAPSVNMDGSIAYLLIGNDETGRWMRGSAADDPGFQARIIVDFLDRYRSAEPVENASPADSDPLHLTAGQYLFGRDCQACHSIGRGGNGGKIAPDLLGVARTHDLKWLARMIQRPNQLLNEHDPIATALLQKYKVRMPNLSISDDELRHLLEYIEAQTAARAKDASSGSDATAPTPQNR